MTIRLTQKLLESKRTGKASDITEVARKVSKKMSLNHSQKPSKDEKEKEENHQNHQNRQKVADQSEDEETEA